MWGAHVGGVHSCVYASTELEADCRREDALAANSSTSGNIFPKLSKAKQNLEVLPQSSGCSLIAFILSSLGRTVIDAAPRRKVLKCLQKMRRIPLLV